MGNMNNNPDIIVTPITMIVNLYSMENGIAVEINSCCSVASKDFNTNKN
jgi:hypothetical protein